MNKNHVTLTLAGRETRRITLDVESIESFSGLRYLEGPEGSNTRIRMKSGDEYFVIEQPHQVLAQAGDAV